MARRTASRPLLPFLCAMAATVIGAPAAEARITLSDGHVDAGAARIVGGQLRSYVKDASGGRVVWREPESVTLRVVDRARVRLPSGMDSIGPKGQTVWMIPQVQKSGIIWAGWNTEEIRRSQVDGQLAWQLRAVSGPGRVVLFQTGSFGDERILFSSRRGLPQTYNIPPGTHAHGNWAFTREGTYRLTFAMSVRSRSGKRLSDTSTLTFRIG